MNASLKSWIIWSIASNEIVDLLTTQDLNELARLRIEVVKKTGVSWAEVIQAIMEVDLQYSSQLH